jgi:hypothetical protein
MGDRGLSLVAGYKICAKEPEIGLFGTSRGCGGMTGAGAPHLPRILHLLA